MLLLLLLLLLAHMLLLLLAHSDSTFSMQLLLSLLHGPLLSPPVCVCVCERERERERENIYFRLGYTTCYTTLD